MRGLLHNCVTSIFLVLLGYQSACQPSLNDAQLSQDETASSLPMQGPGLGNLEYTGSEMFRPLSLINSSNFIPPRLPYNKDFGLNTAMLHNGYFVTLFAPDSGGGPGGILVLDVSNPRDVKLVRRIYEPEGITKEFREAHALGSAYVQGKKLVALQSGFGIEIWDFSDVNTIAPLSKLRLPGVNFGDYSSVAWQLSWQAPYLYVAGANQGIFIVDTSDPWHPKLADRGAGKPNPVPVGELGGFRVGPIFTLGNLLVISSMDVADGFSTLDISDPVNPQLLSRVARLKDYYATCFDGRYLHASTRGFGARMQSYDLTDPIQPRMINDALLIDEQLYCATQDHFVFQGAQQYFHKIDVSQSSSFRETGRGTLAVDHPDHGQVTPFGNLIFVGNDHGSGSAFFPHQTAPDRRAPELVRQSPASGETNVALTSRIGLAFSDNIQFESLTPNNFQVRDEHGEVVNGTFSVQLGLVNFAPRDLLRARTRYDVVLKAQGLRDYAGNGLIHDIRYSFVTGDGSTDPQRGIAYYSMDEGMRSDLQMTNPEFRDGALVLEAGSEIRLPSHIASKVAGNASLSFYLKTQQRGNDAPWLAPGLMGQDQVGGEYDIFWGWLDAQGRLRLSTGNDTGATTNTPINDGLWHHFVLTRDAGNGELKIYKDGRLENTRFGQSGRIDLNWDRIGKILPSGSEMQAELDDLRIFDRVLGADEITALANKTVISLSSATLRQKQLLDEPMVLSVSGLRGPAQDLTLTWDFGDGNQAVGTSAVHSYQKPGLYNIRLIATSPNRTETIALTKRVYRRPTERPPLRSSTVVSDQTLAYIVNPDANTVSAIDYGKRQKVWEQAVGQAPRTVSLGSQRRLWVANQGSDSLTVLAADGSFVQTIELPYGTAPYAVLVDTSSGLVYVSGESGRSLLLLDESGRLLERKTLAYKPRGLALDSTRKALYVTRFISAGSAAEIHRFNAGTLNDEQTLSIPLDGTTVDAEDRGRGIANYLSQLAISPDGRSLMVPTAKHNILRGLYRSNQTLTPDSTVRTVLNQISLDDQAVTQLDFNDREGAVASVFSPIGDFVFTALQGSQSVEIIDAFRQISVGSIDQVGLAPQGLDISPDGSYLFVQGFLSRTIAIYDIRSLLAGSSYAPALVAKIPTVAHELLSEKELLGKRIFYQARDARMSRDGYISCASCHLDGGDDGQVWDFTERGEGLRNTISLKGHRGSGEGRVHWTANFDEIQDFENDIRFGFGGAGFMSDSDFALVKDPLGLNKAGISPDLDALAVYVSSLRSYGRSPYRPQKDQLSELAAKGQMLFDKFACGSCHAGPEFTDNKRHDIGTIGPESGLGQAQKLDGIGFDTPTLRGLWETAPYLHAGQANSVPEAIEAHDRALSARPGPEELQALEAYLLSLE